MGTCIDRLTAVLHAAWFAPLVVGLPSVSRWHTVGPTLATQTGGLLCHRIMGRVFLRVFQSAQDADVQADDEANSFHYHCNKKRRQALEFWADQPRSSEVLLTALLSTEPLDKLSARLQMLDEAGNAMTEFVDPTPRGLLHKCLRHLSDLLTPFVHGADNDHAPKLEASVRHLEQWFAPGFNRSTYFNSMRSAILSISSSVLRKRTFTPLHFPQTKSHSSMCHQETIINVIHLFRLPKSRPVGNPQSSTIWSQRQLRGFKNNHQCVIQCS